MQRKHILIFLGISLLLHFLLLLLIFSSLFSSIFQLQPLATTPKRITVTLAPEPAPHAAPDFHSAQANPKKMFVDTAESLPSKTPPPNTPFEGERNTQAASTTPGIGNPFLPNQQGENIPGVTLHNQDYSPQTQSKPQPPASPSRETEAQQQQQEQQPQTAASPEKKQAPPGIKENLPLRPGGLVSLSNSAEPRPPAPDPREAREPQQPQPSQPAQKNQEAEAAPAAFSAQKRATAIHGGASIGEDASIGAEDSPEGRYKAKLYRAIGSRWYIYVRQDGGLLPIGTVKIHFYVRSDGSITEIQVAEGGQLDKLVAISRSSILEISGQIEPFPAAMKEKLGNGFYDDVTFTIY